MMHPKLTSQGQLSK